MIVNQPHDKQLGIQLIEALESDKYQQLTIMVAYAKLSGVYRVLPYIKKFRDQGHEVRFVIGIDQQNTTYDALYQLMKVADVITIFHSENMTQTFHIKCYWLKGDSECWYAIGSNNLTAGGLFSNYELSTTNTVSGKKSLEANSELDSIYKIYSDPTSLCTHDVSEDFLDELLDSKYIVREIQQRKELLKTVGQTGGKGSKKKIFGNEVFPAPKLPEEYRKATQLQEKKGPHAAEKEKSSLNRENASVPHDSKYENNYLIRLVPKAGNRSKQVHFTVELLEKYFCLTPGDGILLQEMFPEGSVGEIEQRQVIFSQRNRNVKIELAGAAILDTEYPDDLENRPVLVIKRVNSNLFVYMILMNGDDGYTTINNRLKSLPAGRSLPYEVIDEGTMFSLWSNCPMT